MRWVFGGCFLWNFYRDYSLDFVNRCELLQVLKIFDSEINKLLNILYVDLDYWLNDY